MRSRRGLTQAELARAAGMTRSVVNAYERGRRQPSVEATGGRGIPLVDQLSSVWGVDRTNDGKRVWFELRA